MFDWDDSKRVIRWVDEDPTSPSKLALSETTPVAAKAPRKRRVVEAEIEPSHSVVPGKSMELDLICSANCNYTKYVCKTDRIYFKDTYIFQTRVFQVRKLQVLWKSLVPCSSERRLIPIILFRLPWLPICFFPTEELESF